MTAHLPAPVVNGDSEQFWSAIQQRELPLRRCKACGKSHFMPRYLCPSCWSTDLEWTRSAGSGAVHSFTIVRRAADPRFIKEVPYVVALIDLDEGPRMVANIRGPDALEVSIGDRVTVQYEDRANGTLIAQFVRAPKINS